MLLTMNSVIQ